MIHPGKKSAVGHAPRVVCDRKRTCPITAPVLVGEEWTTHPEKIKEQCFAPGASQCWARGLPDGVATVRVWPDTRIRHVVERAATRVPSLAEARQVAVSVTYIDFTGQVAQRPLGVVTLHGPAERRTSANALTIEEAKFQAGDVFTVRIDSVLPTPDPSAPAPTFSTNLRTATIQVGSNVLPKLPGAPAAAAMMPPPSPRDPDMMNASFSSLASAGMVSTASMSIAGGALAVGGDPLSALQAPVLTGAPVLSVQPAAPPMLPTPTVPLSALVPAPGQLMQAPVPVALPEGAVLPQGVMLAPSPVQGAPPVVVPHMPPMPPPGPA